MIAEPINDRDCLLPTSHYALGQLARADLLQLARTFRNTVELALWIRSLPQLNDTGNNRGMPTIACDTPQRARLPTSTPNCYERALLYLVLAEMIDPMPARQLATRNTSAGRHTVVVEEGTEINLNPSRVVESGEPDGHQRNASFQQLAEERGHPHAPRPGEHGNTEMQIPDFRQRRRRQPPEWVRVLTWCIRIAECHADVIDELHGKERMRRVRGFFARRGLAPRLHGQPPPEPERGDFDFSVHAAELGAQHYGNDGKWAVTLYRRALDKMELLVRPQLPPPRAPGREPPHDHHDAHHEQPPPRDPRADVHHADAPHREAPHAAGLQPGATRPPADAHHDEQAKRNALYYDEETGELMDDEPREFGDGMATLHDFTEVDSWEPYRNAVELSHFADPDWRNCGCGMPRNAVELEELHRNFSWKGFGQDTLGVVHGIGGGILKTYGLGGVSDQLGNVYEKQGWVKPQANRPPPGGQQQQQGGGGGGRVWQGVQAGSAQLEQQAAAERERLARAQAAEAEAAERQRQERERAAAASLAAERQRLISERAALEAERARHAEASHSRRLEPDHHSSTEEDDAEAPRPLVGSLAAV